MRALTGTLLVAAALAAPQALAQQGWYAGLGVGQAKLDISGADLTGVPGASFDDKDTAYNLRLGHRFHPNMAVELGYYHLGDYDFGLGPVSGTAEARSVGLSLLGILPLDRFDVFVRAGYARSEAKVKVAAGSLSVSDKERENEWFAGLGGRWHVSPNLAVGVEFMRHDKLEIDSYFLNVDLRF